MNWLINIFDRLHHFWDRPATERGIGLILIWIYAATIVAVELVRLGYFPEWLPPPPPTHFFSIQLAFTLILGVEVISLIFILPASLSRSIGKQLEILTMILLRNAFKVLSILPEPVSVTMDNLDNIIDIAASGTGAFLVFICLGFYRQWNYGRKSMHKQEIIDRYIKYKKMLSLLLLVIFVGIGIRDGLLFYYGKNAEFFETIYTVLIFADIAMVLISQRFMPCYYAVFRNSGFVIGTLMMRLSLSAPYLLCAGIAVFSALYVLALTWGTNMFAPLIMEKKEE